MKLGVVGLPNVGKYALSLENFQNAVEYMKIQIRGREYAGVFAQFIYALMYAFGCTIANVFSKVFAASCQLHGSSPNSLHALSA